MLTNIVHHLLSTWRDSTENEYYRYRAVADERWKVLLVQNLQTQGYCMGIYIKSERGNPLQIEGETTDFENELLSIINEETIDGWLYIGGKQIYSLDYFLPEDLIKDTLGNVRSY